MGKAKRPAKAVLKLRDENVVKAHQANQAAMARRIAKIVNSGNNSGS